MRAKRVGGPKDSSVVLAHGLLLCEHATRTTCQWDVSARGKKAQRRKEAQQRQKVTSPVLEKIDDQACTQRAVDAGTRRPPAVRSVPTHARSAYTCPPTRPPARPPTLRVSKRSRSRSRVRTQVRVLERVAEREDAEDDMEDGPCAALDAKVLPAVLHAKVAPDLLEVVPVQCARPTPNAARQPSIPIPIQRSRFNERRIPGRNLRVLCAWHRKRAARWFNAPFFPHVPLQHCARPPFRAAQASATEDNRARTSANEEIQLFFPLLPRRRVLDAQARSRSREREKEAEKEAERRGEGSGEKEGETYGAKVARRYCGRFRSFTSLKAVIFTALASTRSKWTKRTKRRRRKRRRTRRKST